MWTVAPRRVGPVSVDGDVSLVRVGRNSPSRSQGSFLLFYYTESSPLVGISMVGKGGRIVSRGTGDEEPLGVSSTGVTSPVPEILSVHSTQSGPRTHRQDPM